MSFFEGKGQILYLCVRPRCDTEKSQEEMQEELEGLEYDIYNAMGMIANVTATPNLDDNLEVWNYINTMENAVEELRESYAQYENLVIRLRG